MGKGMRGAMEGMSSSVGPKADNKAKQGGIGGVVQKMGMKQQPQQQMQMPGSIAPGMMQQNPGMGGSVGNGMPPPQNMGVPPWLQFMYPDMQPQMGGVVPGQMGPGGSPGGFNEKGYMQSLPMPMPNIPPGGNGMGGPPVNPIMGGGVRGQFDPEDMMRNVQPNSSGRQLR